MLGTGVPAWATAPLRTRQAAGIRLDDPIFTDTLGGFRDPNNVPDPSAPPPPQSATPPAATYASPSAAKPA
jgi:hypothetical protein